MYPVMGLPPVSLPVSGCHDSSTALVVTLVTITDKALATIMYINNKGILINQVIAMYIGYRYLTL